MRLRFAKIIINPCKLNNDLSQPNPVELNPPPFNSRTYALYIPSLLLDFSTGLAAGSGVSPSWVLRCVSGLLVKRYLCGDLAVSYPFVLNFGTTKPMRPAHHHCCWSWWKGHLRKHEQTLRTQTTRTYDMTPDDTHAYISFDRIEVCMTWKYVNYIID